MTEKQKTTITKRAERALKIALTKVAADPKNVNRIYADFTAAIMPDFNLSLPRRRPMAEYVDFLNTSMGLQIYAAAKAAA